MGAFFFSALNNGACPLFYLLNVLPYNTATRGVNVCEPYRPGPFHSDIYSGITRALRPRSLLIDTEPQPPHVHIREVEDRIELRQRHPLHSETRLVIRLGLGLG